MKKIRLDEKAYLEKGETVLITICTKERLHLFAGEKLVEIFATKLIETTQQHNLTIVIYCFTPDHLHILVNNTSGSSIVEFVRDLKYKYTREAWTFGYQGAVFQKSFHDHFVRKEEDLKALVDYIYQNPIRKGLPPDRLKSPYVGSDLYVLK
ncbi:MAG: transposase [bacterium]